MFLRMSGAAEEVGYITERKRGNGCFYAEKTIIAQSVCNSSAGYGHEQSADVRDDYLYGEVGSLESFPHTEHGRRIYHHCPHAIAGPKKYDTPDEPWL